MVNMWYRDPTTKQLMQIPILTPENADGLYVNKSGDTMTGDLKAPSVTIGDQGHLATVSNAVALYKDSNPANGLANLYVLPPTQTDHAATLGYVDNRIQMGSGQTPGNVKVVTFAHPYKTPPFVIIAASDAYNITELVNLNARLYAEEITTTGFKAVWLRGDAGGLLYGPFTWVAIGDPQ